MQRESALCCEARRACEVTASAVGQRIGASEQERLAECQSGHEDVLFPDANPGIPTSEFMVLSNLEPNIVFYFFNPSLYLPFECCLRILITWVYPHFYF